MANTLRLVTRFLPVTADDDTALPHMHVVASITTDERFLGSLDPYNRLVALADKMGLVQYEIWESDADPAPGMQADLFD